MIKVGWGSKVRLNQDDIMGIKQVKKALPYLAPFLIILWIAWINRFPEGYTFAAGDFGQPLNIQEMFGRFFYIWGNKIVSRAEGGPFPWSTAWLFYFFLYFIPAKLGLTDTQILSVVLFSFLSLCYVSFLLSLKILFKKVISLPAILLSLVYSLNLTTLYFFTYAWGPSHHVLLYIFIPVIAALFIKVLERPRKEYFLLLLITLFLSIPSYTNSAFAVSLCIFLALVLVFSLVTRLFPLRKKQLIILGLLPLGAICVLAYWLFPTLAFVKEGLAFLTSGSLFDLASWVKSQSLDIFSIFLNTPHYLSFYPFKYDAGLLSYFSFIPILLFPLAMVKKDYDRRTYKLLLVFAATYLCFVFLAKKANPPLTDLTLWLFKLPLFSTLRSYEKVTVFVPFLLLVPIYAYITNIVSKRLKAAVLLLLGLTFISVRPYFFGGIQTKYSITFPKGETYQTADYSIIAKIPDDYHDLADASNKNVTDTRIQSLPFSALNSMFWVNYPKWKAIGSDITESFFNKSVLFANDSMYASFGWNPNQFFNISPRDPAWFVKMLPLFNVSEIFYHLDVADDFVAQSLAKIRNLEERGLIFPIAKTDIGDLYGLDEKYVFPHFYVPDQLVTVGGDVSSLPAVVSYPGYQLKSALQFFGGGYPKRQVVSNDATELLIRPERMKVVAGGPRLSVAEINSLLLPQTRILPGSALYFLVEKKEERLVKGKGDLVDKTDLLLWLVSKRVMEMEMLSAKGNNEKMFPVFLRYIDQLKEVADNLDKLSRERTDSYKVLEKAQQYFVLHRRVLTKLYPVLLEEGFGDQLSDVMDIYEKVNFLLLGVRNDYFLFSAPEAGDYEIFVWGEEGITEHFEKASLRKMRLVFDGGEKVSSVPILGKDGWYRFPGVNLSSGWHSLSVSSLEPKNLLEEVSLDTLSAQVGKGVSLEYSPEAVEGGRSIKVMSQGYDAGQMEFEVHNFKPGSKYLISFYYKSVMGAPLELIIWQGTDAADTDAFSSGESIGYTYRGRLDKSPLWERKTITLVTRADATRLKVIFKPPELPDLNVSLIEGLGVERVFDPEIILRLKRPAPKVETTAPKLTFSRVNLTKYRVLVEGAYEPYLLVFSETFHKGWKAYIRNVENRKADVRDFYGKSVASYFSGDVVEGEHRNVFLDHSTFETWGMRPLSEEKHYPVNGYANSWYITPDDVGGQKSYEIIVEFRPQHLFYVGLFISGLSFLLCLILLVVITARKRFYERYH